MNSHYCLCIYQCGSGRFGSEFVVAKQRCRHLLYSHRRAGSVDDRRCVRVSLQITLRRLQTASTHSPLSRLLRLCSRQNVFTTFIAIISICQLCTANAPEQCTTSPFLFPFPLPFTLPSFPLHLFLQIFSSTFFLHSPPLRSVLYNVRKRLKSYKSACSVYSREQVSRKSGRVGVAYDDERW